MKASASAGKASELSCVQEWGAGAVSALLQRDGAEALKTTKQDEVIKTLLGAAESYPTSLSVSQEVCAALMSVINVGGPTEGLAHLPKRLADGMVQALSVALDVHKEDDRVQELALAGDLHVRGARAALRVMRAHVSLLCRMCGWLA